MAHNQKFNLKLLAVLASSKSMDASWAVWNSSTDFPFEATKVSRVFFQKSPVSSTLKTADYKNPLFIYFSQCLTKKSTTHVLISTGSFTNDKEQIALDYKNALTTSYLYKNYPSIILRAATFFLENKV